MATVGCTCMDDHADEVELIVFCWVTHLNFVHGLIVVSSTRFALLFLALFLLFLFLVKVLLSVLF